MRDTALDHVAGDNRGAYINALLKQERTNFLKQALIKANREEAEDTDYQEELQSWESTLSDGLILNRQRLRKPRN